MVHTCLSLSTESNISACFGLFAGSLQALHPQRAVDPDQPVVRGAHHLSSSQGNPTHTTKTVSIDILI